MVNGRRATDPIDVIAWQEHSMFNAYRYGYDAYERVAHTVPTVDDVREFLAWADAWEKIGIPG